MFVNCFLRLAHKCVGDAVLTLLHEFQRYIYLQSVNVYSVLLWWYLSWCLLRFPFCVAWYSHRPQGYFLPKCIEWTCLVRSPFEVAWWSHSLHGYFFPSCIASWWLLRPLLLDVWWPQVLQVYFMSWCKLLLWILSIPLVPALYWHWSQANMFPISLVVIN